MLLYEVFFLQKTKMIDSIAGPSMRPLREMDGYDLVTKDVLDVGSGFSFQKAHQGTNVSASYRILEDGNDVGGASLDFDLYGQEVLFDIKLSERGRGIAASALGELASRLNERGFNLVTATVAPESRGYWEHLAERGEVIAVDPSDPETDYVVSPVIPDEVK